MGENRLAHAIIFLGKEGSGALPLAIAFAQYIVCERVNPPATNINNDLFETSLFQIEPLSQKESFNTPDGPVPADSCGVCPACLKSAHLAHPDIHFSYPVVTKKTGTPPLSTDYISEWREFIAAYPYGNVYDWLQFIGAENKQGNITAAECNDIIHKLSLKSFEGGYKVLIMWLPEYLGTEGNKLLKLIEEPPPNTVFLLVAENDEAILPTILSRCQLIKVPMLSAPQIEQGLTERNRLSAQAAREIANISQGNYREALQLSQSADADWQSLLRDWLNAMLKNGPIAQIKWVEEISKLGRENQKQFLKYFNHLLQLAIRMGVSPQAGNTASERDRDFADRINKITGFEEQQCIVEELDKASYYIERNANTKMLFAALTIKIYHIIKDKIVFLNE